MKEGVARRAGFEARVKSLREQGWFRVLEVVLAVLAAAGLAWGAIGAIADARRDLELRVEIDEVTRIVPAPDGAGVELPAGLRTADFATVDELRLLVRNAGKEVIGSQEQTWGLALRMPGAAELYADPERLRPRPPAVVAELAASTVDEVVMTLGALEPGARVEVPLVVVDRPAGSEGRHDEGLEAKATLAGLPRPAVTSLSDFDIVRARLAGVIMVAIVVLLIIGAVFDAGDEWRARWVESKPKTVLAGIGSFLLFVVLAGINALFIGSGLAWLLT